MLIPTLWSLLFPGLGQIYKQRFLKGLTFIGLQAIFIGLWRITFGLTGILALLLWYVGVVDANIRTNGASVTTRKNRNMILGLGIIMAWLSTSFTVNLALKPFGAHLIFPFFEINGPINNSDVEIKAKTYLEEKYKKKFVVENIKYRITANGNHYYGSARDNEDIVFPISGGIDNSGVLNLKDNYLEQLWNQQLEQKLDPILRELFGDDYEFYAVHSFLDRDRIPSLIVNLEEITKMYPLENVIRLKVNIYRKKEKFNRQKEISSLYSLVTELRKLNPYSNVVTVRYFNAEMEEEQNKAVSASTFNRHIEGNKKREFMRMELDKLAFASIFSQDSLESYIQWKP